MGPSWSSIFNCPALSQPAQGFSAPLPGAPVPCPSVPGSAPKVEGVQREQQVRRERRGALGSRGDAGQSCWPHQGCDSLQHRPGPLCSTYSPPVPLSSTKPASTAPALHRPLIKQLSMASDQQQVPQRCSRTHTNTHRHEPHAWHCPALAPAQTGLPSRLGLPVITAV